MGKLGTTILIADDQEEIRHMLRLRLTIAGYEVVEAEDGAQACEIAESRPIDLLLLDVMMPTMTGFDALAKLRRSFGKTDLPIIMLTARDDGDDVIKALRLGANDYITKPVRFDSLQERMKVHLAIKRGNGQRLGRYVLIDKLGEGGMGQVFSATDSESGAQVAIKVLPRSMTVNDSYVMRFLREGRIASRLNHPHLVRVLEVGRIDQTYFLAMELIKGDDLRNIVNRSGALPLPRALRYTRQLVLALEAVCHGGVLHRDIKPENILVDSADNARLTDFGIAREQDGDAGRMTGTGSWIGSPVFASPEQLHGKGDHRSDLYSLGCTLFSILCGKDPFADTLDIVEMARLKAKRPPSLRSVDRSLPRSVAKLVARMMAPKPERRYQTHDALLDDIDRLLQKSQALAA